MKAPIFSALVAAVSAAGGKWTGQKVYVSVDGLTSLTLDINGKVFCIEENDDGNFKITETNANGFWTSNVYTPGATEVLLTAELAALDIRSSTFAGELKNCANSWACI